MHTVILTGTMTNNEDPDEMLHNVAFHQFHSTLFDTIKTIFRETHLIMFEIITSDPVIYAIDYHKKHVKYDNHTADQPTAP